jgi:tetratricopeptide (TPR) repeat protein
MKRMILAGALALVSGVTGLMAQQKQPQPKSPKEVEALQAMFGAQDPDSRIKAGEEVLTKFADTEFKSTAMYLIAASYEQKNDFPKMAVWAEKTIEVDPKNYAAMLMLAGGIVKNAKEHDLDLEEKLGRSEKYAKTAVDLIGAAEKPNPQLPDEQWANAKKDFAAQSHEVFGLIATLRKKNDVAIAEFKQAVEGSPNADPTTYIRLARAYTSVGKHDDAIAVLDKVMANAEIPAQIRQVAQADRVRAIQAKGGAKPPAAATPAAPATTPAPPAAPAPKN